MGTLVWRARHPLWYDVHCVGGQLHRFRFGVGEQRVTNPVQLAPHAHLAAQMLRQERRRLAESVAGRLERSHSSAADRFAGSAEFSIRVQQVETHLDTLAACIEFSSPVILDDYVRRVAAASQPACVARDDLATVFSEVVGVAQQKFPREALMVILDYLDRAMQTSDEVPRKRVAAVADASHTAIQQRYLAALLSMRRDEAMQLVLAAAKSGMSVESLYLRVLQPTLQQVGDLWQAGEICVSQEHYCSSVTEAVMARLHPYLPPGHDATKTLVAACVSNELHEVGLRMVADLFQGYGWNTVYLGANMPARNIVNAVLASRAQVLAVSTTMTQHLFSLAEVIRLLQSSSGCEHVKLLVGGYPFNTDPLLWKRMGADATARNAKAAVRLSAQLV